MSSSLLQLGLVDVFLYVLIGWLVYKYVWKTRERSTKRVVAIVVLGDIGRSPRMMYHCESLAKAGFDTYIVGYKGTSPPPSLLEIPHVHFRHLMPPPAFISKLPRTLFIIWAPFKVLLQVVTILVTLMFRIPHPPEFIMVQNPPTIPTLALVQLVSRIRGSKLIIDWHNLGYTILSLRLGESSFLVKIAKWFEQTFGRKAFAHLFVTNAMKERLVREWDLVGTKIVFYDRPLNQFRPASAAETHDLLIRLPTFFPPSLSSFLPKYSLPHSTPFTQLTSPSDPSLPADAFTSSSSSLMTHRPGRPAFIVSSTSWTADEDFSILLRAMATYERRAKEVNSDRRSKVKLPKIVVVVTGKGELKGKYMREVEARERNGDWKWVRCLSVWLEAKDYPVLLGSADFGVSLHSSSSGLDLPMKVVDMFGCGLPVCALDFPCLNELVQTGVNGLVFNDSDQLAQQFEHLLTSYPHSDALSSLRGSLKRESSTATKTWKTWDENWDEVLKPLFLGK